MSANYSASISGGSDSIDVFSLNLSRTTWFTANLTSPAGQNYDIDLLNSTFQVIDSSSTNGSDQVSTASQIIQVECITSELAIHLDSITQMTIT